MNLITAKGHTMKTKHTHKFGFDGRGINDYNDEYKARIATLTEHGHDLKAGALLAAAPDLLAALKTLVGEVENLIAEDTLPFAAGSHPAMIAAHAAIDRAEGEA